MRRASAVRAAACGALALLGAACAAPQQADNFIPSTRSAVELRAIQTRVVDGDPDAVLRGVVATLHDLGYRITKAEVEAGTVSATRLTGLRVAAVVRPAGPGQSAVRANATVLAMGREAQVDDPRFYQRNFFEPLGATMNRRVADAPADLALPDAVRPTAELMPADRRRAAASAPRPATGTPGAAPAAAPARVN